MLKTKKKKTKQRIKSKSIVLAIPENDIVNIFLFSFIALQQRSPWRNRLARSAVNRKVGGSSPPGDALLSFFLFSKHHTN